MLELQDRVRRLERSLLVWRVLGLLAIVTFVVAGKSSPGVVEASKFVLLDSAGKIRGEWKCGPADDYVDLSLFGSTTHDLFGPLASLSVTTDQANIRIQDGITDDWATILTDKTGGAMLTLEGKRQLRINANSKSGLAVLRDGAEVWHTP